MSPFLRKVKTASGATAVQIVVKEGRKNRIIEHLGSAHDEAGLAVLMAAGRAKLVPPDQQMLDFSAATPTQPAVVTGSSSALLVEVVRAAWKALGFDVVGDEAFFQLVLARLVEPTSMLDSARVLTELGIVPVHRGEDASLSGQDRKAGLPRPVGCGLLRLRHQRRRRDTSDV